MTRWIIEMRIPVPVETVDPGVLAVVRGDLRDAAAEHGWEPRFVTVEEWRYWGQFQTPLPFRNTRGVPEAEHTGKLKPQRDRRMAQ